VYCNGDSCKITIAASGWGNFDCPSLNVPCEDLLFFYTNSAGQVLTCYSSGDCYNPTLPPVRRILEGDGAAAPAKTAAEEERSQTEEAPSGRGLLRGAGGPVVATAAAAAAAAAAAPAPVSEDGR
jgi:hypothetical protein